MQIRSNLFFELKLSPLLLSVRRCMYPKRCDDAVSTHILLPLTLAGNGLKFLPASVAALASLRTLRVSSNALTSIPKELESLPLLQEVHVDGNSGLRHDVVLEFRRHRPDVRVVGAEEKDIR